MSYSSDGPKPFEGASKASHHHIVNDEKVKILLEQLYVPPRDSLELALRSISQPFQVVQSKIRDIVAIDGGYTEVPIRSSYPSATIHFFQFGALHFKFEHLKKLKESRHPDPEDVSRIKNIERLKLALPTKGVRHKDIDTLRDTVRKAIYDFFYNEKLEEEHSLINTISWFIFHKYKGTARLPEECTWKLSSNPYGVDGDITFDDSTISKEYTVLCPITNKIIYLTDVFRLHEIITEETGAAGICGYLAGVIEHIIAIHILRHLISKNAQKLNEVLLLMDRPTGFFGQTARMHVLMLDFVIWIQNKHNLYLAGIEKSGAFVEHAKQIQSLMTEGSFLLLNDEYIYKYIIPGEENPTTPYAYTANYGHKVIFKTRAGQMYVVSIPAHALKKNPTKPDLKNIDEILTHIEELKCDMYENSLLPIALANKLVSLSAHPSTQILTQFAKATIEEGS
jgi:hypothetical protein